MLKVIQHVSQQGLLQTLARKNSIYNIVDFKEKDLETLINLCKIFNPHVVGIIIPHKGKLMMV